MKRVALVLLGMCAMAACDAFEGGAEAPAESGDAGAPVLDGAPAEPRDGAAKVDDDAARPVSGCGLFSDASFCADFDDGIAPGSWDARGYEADGSVAIVPGGALLTPYAGEVVVAGGAGVAGRYLERGLSATEEVRVRADALFPDPTGEGPDYVIVLTISLSDGTNVYEIRVTSQPKTLATELAIVDSATDTKLASTSLANTSFTGWTSIELDVAAHPLSASLRVGAAASAKAVWADAGSLTTPSSATVRAGAVQRGATDATTRIRIDNIAGWLR